MFEHWERLAEAQRIRQEIDADFQETLSHLGRETAERLRRAYESGRDEGAHWTTCAGAGRR